MRAMEHLSLQIAGIDNVIINYTDRADPCRGEIEPGRRAESTSTNQEHATIQQLLLASDANLRDAQMAAVSLTLLRVKLFWLLDG